MSLLLLIHVQEKYTMEILIVPTADYHNANYTSKIAIKTIQTPILIAHCIYINKPKYCITAFL